MLLVTTSGPYNQLKNVDLYCIFNVNMSCAIGASIDICGIIIVMDIIGIINIKFKC